MKKVIAALTILILAAFLASSTWSIWSFSVQLPSSTSAGILGEAIMETTEIEKAQSHEVKAEENVSGSLGSSGNGGGNTESAETWASQSATSIDSLPEDSPFPSETSQGTGVSSTPRFPDGAIYYGGEPPYAYIPTYDPKEPNIIRIPGVPPELLGA